MMSKFLLLLVLSMATVPSSEQEAVDVKDEHLLMEGAPEWVDEEGKGIAWLHDKVRNEMYGGYSESNDGEDRNYLKRQVLYGDSHSHDCNKNHAPKCKVKGKWTYCHYNDPKPYMGFAAMTPYSAAVKETIKAKKVIPEGCQAKQIWMLQTSGSFNPYLTNLKRIKRQMPSIKKAVIAKRNKSFLCKKDLKLLQRWRPENINFKERGQITKAGEDDIMGIASRFKKEFPDLMHVDPPSTKTLITPGGGNWFAFSPTRHTYSSANIFVHGLSSKNSDQFDLDKNNASGILQFHDHCSKYIKKVLMLPKEKKPYHVFMKGDIMKALRHRVSKRLGAPMTMNRIRAMYNTCRNLKAMNPKKLSAWCVAFTPKDLKILEYWEDLRMYSDQGYLNRYSHSTACFLGKDIMMRFRERVIDKEIHTNLTAFFVNSDATVMFTAFLRLFKDHKPLTEHKINRYRRWRTSKFAGFSSNYVFYLSSCKKNSWWVSATLNEAPLQLKGCKNTLGCPWKKFVKKYAFLNKCLFFKDCGRIDRKNDAWRDIYRKHNWR